MRGEPLLDRALQGWIVNTAKRNYWRVYCWYELDDLVQDGLLCYAKCKRRYAFLDVAEPTKEQQKWFMSLVCTSFVRYIDSLAGKRWDEESNYLPLEEIADSEVCNSVHQPWGMLLVGEAPSAIRRLVSGLASDVAGYARQRLVFAKTKTTPRLKRLKRPLRETTNQFYCRLAGEDPQQVNMVSVVNAYFS